MTARPLSRLLSIFRFAVAIELAAAFVVFGNAPASAQVAVTVNGSEVDFASAPIIQAGRVFVPLRGVFEQLGATVVYDDGSIDATSSTNTDVHLHIGSTQATVNGQPVTIDVAPFIVGDTTFVTLRFIAQALGADVAWDESSRLVSISLAGSSDSQGYVAPASDTDVTQAPPPLPDYDVPPVPAPNEIWEPGYWGWGAVGYYWVPGVWVAPPEVGYVWTPGYWAWANSRFGWHAGFWARTVGFYGGVDYGGGYFGHGYAGGRWQHDVFYYNTAVTRVDVTIIKNVYVDRTVIVDVHPTRVSYNGGPAGIRVRPTAAELAVAHAPHVGLTAEQRQHVLIASKDRRLLVTVNHAQPPIAAVAQPLKVEKASPSLVPLRASDRVERQIEPLEKPAYVAPPVRPAFVASPKTTLVPPRKIVTPITERTPYVAPKPASTPPKTEHFAPKTEYDPRTLAPFVRPVAPVRTVHPVATITHPPTPVPKATEHKTDRKR